MNRIPLLLLTAALGGAFAGACARDGVTPSMIERGEAHAATVESAGHLGDLLDGDYLSGSGENARSLHIRRLPEFGRGFYVELIRTAEPEAPMLQAVWIPVVRDGRVYIDQYRITDPEEYVGAWNDEELLAVTGMYELRRMEYGAIPATWVEADQAWRLGVTNPFDSDQPDSEARAFYTKQREADGSATFYRIDGSISEDAVTLMWNTVERQADGEWAFVLGQQYPWTYERVTPLRTERPAP
jgi:hypothetical protein